MAIPILKLTALTLTTFLISGCDMQEYLDSVDANLTEQQRQDLNNTLYNNTNNNKNDTTIKTDNNNDNPATEDNNDDATNNTDERGVKPQTDDKTDTNTDKPNNYNDNDNYNNGIDDTMFGGMGPQTNDNDRYNNNDNNDKDRTHINTNRPTNNDRENTNNNDKYNNNDKANNTNTDKPETTNTPTKDTVKPVINLNGKTTITLYVGDKYKEPGATAKDNVDGDVAVKIDNSRVNTSKAGTYKVYYTATDSAGNKARVTRTVIVKEKEKTQQEDKIKPVIHLNGKSTITLYVGDKYEEMGATATDNVDGEVSVRINNKRVDTSKAGTYKVYYTATDSAGNKARVVRTVIVKEKEQTQAEGQGNITQIDILTLYDDSALDKYGTEEKIRLRAQHLFDVTNQAYKDSGLNMKVHIASLQYFRSGTSDNLKALDKIRYSDEVAQMREKYKGDTVLLYQANSTGYGVCGYSLTVSRYERSSSIKPYMFAEVMANCPIHTTAHEIGHNLGLKHSHKQEGDNVTPYNYGLGYGVVGKFSTIMTYSHIFKVDEITMKFSSPDYECMPGYPCGVPIGQKDEAHATKVLEHTAKLLGDIFK